MIFSIESIKNAQKIYTGPDFPKLVREYKLMGIVSNIYNIETGIVSYTDHQNQTILDNGIKVEINIPEISNFDDALLSLKKNQTGKTDFLTFCFDIGSAGVYKWVVDLKNMTCNYYDKNEKIIISEKIPLVD